MWRIVCSGCLALSCMTAALAADRVQERNRMASGLNAFAVDLYRKLAEAEGNLFVSPLSVSLALGMARAGARGETAAQIDQVLHLPSDFAPAQRALQSALAPPPVREQDDQGQTIEQPAYALDVANALWGQAGHPFRAPFLEALRNEFSAPLQPIDFGNQATARATINDWVAGRTRDRIRDLVPDGMPSADSRLVLVNALYFRAAWADPFNPRATAEAPWRGPGGGSVPLMRRVGHVNYFESPELQVAELPYRGHATSLLIVLPRSPAGLADIERALDPARLAGWLEGLRPRRLSLAIPRFTLTQSYALEGVLGSLGMPLAFQAGAADFSGISAAEPIVIGAVLHKAFVELDEDGTEAAAATAVLMRAGAAAMVEPPTPFVADRPFLFAIRHRDSGAILFIGRLAAP